jgi:general secretion pathway protein A
LELYRQILNELAIDVTSSSRSAMTRKIKQEVLDLSQGKKMKVALIIDEASLLRLEVFTELHTLTQFEQDSKPYLPIILAGQANLVDSLRYRNCLPLANRVVARSHLKGSDLETMEAYLRGLFRKANHLARGAIVAAARNESTVVTADNVRLAATELL